MGRSIHIGVACEKTPEGTQKRVLCLEQGSEEAMKGTYNNIHNI